MICLVYSTSLELPDNITEYIKKDSDEQEIKYYTYDDLIKIHNEPVTRQGIGIIITMNDRIFIVTCNHIIGKHYIDISVYINKNKVNVNVYNSIPEFDLIFLEIIDDYTSITSFTKDNILKINKYIDDRERIKLITYRTNEEIKYDTITISNVKIINSVIRSNIISKMPLISFETTEINKSDIRGISGSPLILDKNIVGMVFSYIQNEDIERKVELEAIPFTLIYEILKSNLENPLYYQKKLGSFYFNTKVVEIEKEDKEIIGHFIDEISDVSYIRKKGKLSKKGALSKKDFKFKTNDIIISINDTKFETDGTIYNDKIGYTIELETYLLLSAYFDNITKYEIMREKNDTYKIILREVYSVLYENVYNINIFNNYIFIKWNGMIFTELSEELIIQLKIKYNISGIPFQKYNMCQNNSRKSILLLDINYDDMDIKTMNIFKTIDAPLLHIFNGNELLFLNKISNKYINNIDELYKYINSIIYNSQITCKFQSASFPTLKMIFT